MEKNALVLLSTQRATAEHKALHLPLSTGQWSSLRTCLSHKG